LQLFFHVRPLYSLVYSKWLFCDVERDVERRACNTIETPQPALYIFANANFSAATVEWTIPIKARCRNVTSRNNSRIENQIEYFKHSRRLGLRPLLQVVKYEGWHGSFSRRRRHRDRLRASHSQHVKCFSYPHVCQGPRDKPCPKCPEFSLGSTRKLLTFRKLPSMYKGLDVLALLYINRNELRQPLASYLLAQDWR